jgi:tRNA G26 N,N-dimethylase Trm1
MMTKTFPLQCDESIQAYETSGEATTDMDNKSDDNKDSYKKKARNDLEKIQKRKEKRLQKLFASCVSEHDDIPYYFTSDEIASKLKIGPPALASIIESLSQAGFRTSRSGLNQTAFKTEAKINEIVTYFK